MSTYNTGFNAEINEQVKMLRDFGTIHRDCEEIKVKAILHEAMRERMETMLHDLKVGEITYTEWVQKYEMKYAKPLLTGEERENLKGKGFDKWGGKFCI